MNNKKLHFNINKKLLLIVLAFSIIPIIYIAIYINIKLTSYLQNQAFLYYSNIVKQVAVKFDGEFDQYNIKMSDITRMENFRKIINWPPYKTRIEERFFLSEIGEDINIPKLNSVIWSIYTNINGLFSLIETNRYSLANNTNYKVHYLVDGNTGLKIDFNKMKTDPLYKKMLSEGRAVFGKLGKNTLNENSDKPVIIYPYNSKNTKTPDILLVAILYEDFLRNIIDNQQLYPGTLYLLDSMNNIVTATHPSRNDYYKYDDREKKFVLDGDSIFNETGLSFYDYQKLNTDPLIFQKEIIKESLIFLDADRNINNSSNEQATSTYSQKYKTVVHKGIKYMIVSAYSEKSGAKFLYFIPVTFVVKPLIETLINISITLLVLIIIIILLSIIFSSHFTKPIKQLALTMVKAGKGDLNLIKPIKTGDEIQMLYDSYNSMIRDLVVTQSKIEAEEDELKTTRLVTITALARLTEYRDESTGKHLDRVREYTMILAKELKKNSKYTSYLTDKYIEDLGSSSVLHDIGKVGIETSILTKPSRLTEEEFNIIKKHTIIAGEALSDADKELGMKSFLTLAKEICFYHHEKYDGTGYPEGLKGTDIPLSARIIALADVYDALTANRCYRKALTHVEATDIILNQDSGHFDPDVVQCFIENQHKFIEIKNKYKNLC